MRIYKEFDFNSFEPWSGAVDTYCKIQDEGKGAEFEQILEDLYPDGMSETELNDLLWFDAEAVFDWLGIEEDDENSEVETEEEEPRNVTDPDDFETFEDFCQDCDYCPYNILPGGMDECRANFISEKRLNAFFKKEYTNGQGTGVE